MVTKAKKTEEEQQCYQDEPTYFEKKKFWIEHFFLNVVKNVRSKIFTRR